VLASDLELITEPLHLEGEVGGGVIVGESVSVRLESGDELVDVRSVGLVLGDESLSSLPKVRRPSVSSLGDDVALDLEAGLNELADVAGRKRGRRYQQVWSKRSSLEE
jgi:hypothetical protein